ncbi:leucyl aminopeptidase family protein [Kiritimatiella glycovorans]|nr:leucyl aminopeptidase family protein [Kiritimatiella glycovorans]
MKISCSSRPRESYGGVWLIFARGTTPYLEGNEPEPLRRAVEDRIEKSGFSGCAGEARQFPAPSVPGGPESILLAGLGDQGASPAALETAAAAAARCAAQNGVETLVLSCALPHGEDDDPASALFRCARGLTCGAASPASSLKSQRPERSLREAVFAGAARKDVRRLRARARTAAREGELMNSTLGIANLPGNRATPGKLVSRIRRLAEKEEFRCEVLGPQRLRREGFGGMTAVGSGSGDGPRLIVLRTGPRKGKPVVLVGKTVTFDSGGLSLKPGKNMEWMRYDKCGGMAVLGAIRLLAATGCPRPVIGLMAAVENMPDGRATRPGDIISMHSGKTVEVINTDAEGRLALADALSWSARFKPAAIVDLATLTGASIVALGSHAAALLDNDAGLRENLIRAGENSGDRVWSLPLWPEYGKALESPFADLRNIGDGKAGAITAAAFLKHFVPEGVPWAHVDIAGTAWEEKTGAPHPPGATLFGARLLVDWIRSGR